MNARYFLLLPICAMALQANAQVDPLDPGFGTNGVVKVTGMYGQYGEFTLPYADGRLLVVSSLFSPILPTQRTQCTRLLVDGSLDAGFGIGGTVELDLMGEDFTAADGVLLPNGSVVLSGVLGHPDFALGGILMKLLPDGSPDPLFDADGIALFPGIQFLHSLIVLADGSVIAGGRGVGFEPIILKVNAFGDLDSDFGSSGYLYVSGSGRITHLERTPDNEVMALGVNNNWNDLYFMKFTTSGDPVTAFGNNGEAIVSIVPSSDVPRSFQILDDGRMMVAMNGGGLDSYLVRLNADGSMDTSFGLGGVVHSSWLPGGDFFFTSAVTTDVSTTIAGFWGLSPGHAYVARLDDSGNPVLGFGNNGKFTLEPDTALMFGACLTTSGQVVVTGGEVLNGKWVILVARMSNSPEGIEQLAPGVEPLSIIRIATDAVRVTAGERIMECWVLDAAGRMVQHLGGNGTAVVDISTGSISTGAYAVVVRTQSATVAGRFVQSE